MFDPHRTRRSDRRYYTRKGQVLQASRVDVQPIIDQRLVPVYKKFLIANGLAYDSPQPSPPAPIEPVGITAIDINGEQYLFSNMTKYTTPTVNLSAVASAGQDLLIIIFLKDTEGNYFCKVTRQTEGTFNETISNNSECYFYHVNSPPYIDLDNLDNLQKGLIDSFGVNSIISFYGSILSINYHIPLFIE